MWEGHGPNVIDIPMFKLRPRPSITTVLALSFTLVIAVLMAITTWLEVERQHDIFLDELEERAIFVADAVDDALAAPFEGQDFGEIARISEIVVGLPDLDKLEVYSPEGRVIIKVGEGDAPDPEASSALRQRALAGDSILQEEWGNTFEVAAPIKVDSVVVGGVSFIHDTSRAGIQARETAIQAIWQTVVLMFVGIAVAYLIAQRLVRPLMRMVEATRNVGRGNLEFVAERPLTREMGELSEAFEEMTASLRTSKGRLQSQADDLATGNLELQFEVKERERAETALRSAHDGLRRAHGELEQRVAERTAELVDVNSSLEEEIAEHARAQREIDSVYSLTPDMLCILDSAGRLRRVNPAFADFFHRFGGDIEGYTLIELAHEEDVPVVTQALSSLSGENDSVRFENRWRTGPEQYRWLAWHAVAVADDQLIYAAARDITDRVTIEQMKDEFVSMVSHELRTPLTAIRGSLGLVSAGALGEAPEAIKEMVDVAMTNSERLVRLVNDILDIHKMESGMVSMEFEPTDVGELMARVTQELSATAAESEVRIDVGSGAHEAVVDPDRIIQTLINLVGNAIKFSPRGGTVWLNAEESGAALRVTVSDEGRGIPHEKLDSIFGRFQQVDASDSRQKGGTGLGLAICRSIVEQHGGRIWAENRAEVGSTFAFEIPVDGPDGVRSERPLALAGDDRDH